MIRRHRSNDSADEPATGGNGSPRPRCASTGDLPRRDHPGLRTENQELRDQLVATPRHPIGSSQRGVTSGVTQRPDTAKPTDVLEVGSIPNRPTPLTCARILDPVDRDAAASARCVAGDVTADQAQRTPRVAGPVRASRGSATAGGPLLPVARPMVTSVSWRVTRPDCGQGCGYRYGRADL